MKNVWITGCLLVALTSCKKEGVDSPNACTAANPLEEVAWLKQTKDGLKCTAAYHYSIVKALYQNQTVYYVNFSCPNCDYVFQATLLDCLGRKVRAFEGLEWQAFDREVTNRQTIYACQP